VEEKLKREKERRRHIWRSGKNELVLEGRSDSGNEGVIEEEAAGGRTKCLLYN